MSGEQQHYVPKFFLRNFTCGKKPKIFVYDKSNDRCFQTNIKNIAAESDFYELQFDNKVLTFEPALSRLEANTSHIVKNLIKNRNLKVLNANDVATLAFFLSVQFVRTKEHRLIFEHIGKLTASMLRKSGTGEKQIKKIIGSPTDPLEGKLFGLKALSQAKEFMPHFLNKVWLLFETTPNHPFFISDNPIVLHNDMDHGAYGNIGLAVKGIQIYLPLSSTICLNLLCPTIAAEFRKSHVNIRALDIIAPGLADKFMRKPTFARAFCEGLLNGTPIKIIEDNVTFINSLQVVYSSRFVYCESNKLELVKRMITDNQRYRKGWKPVMG